MREHEVLPFLQCLYSVNLFYSQLDQGYLYFTDVSRDQLISILETPFPIPLGENSH